MMPEKGTDIDPDLLSGDEPFKIVKHGFQKWGVIDSPESGFLLYKNAKLGFGSKTSWFSIFIVEVGFTSLADRFASAHLWQTDGQILMSFVGREGGELWQYIPQAIEESTMAPNIFQRVYVKNGSQVLEAHARFGLIVDNGFARNHIVESSEYFFGTRMDKVVDILKDIRGDGFWFATETSGLVWSRQPF